MRRASGSLRKLPFVLMATLLAAGGMALFGAPPLAAAGGQAVVSMPSRVLTEGPTVEQLQAQQADVSARLLADLPAGAALHRASVALGDDEIAAIDRADRASTPLRIGLVKPILPTPEVLGLARSARFPAPGRGATDFALPDGDGGLVWALVVTADRGGAIRVHFENFSLPLGAEMWVYNRDGEAYGPYTLTGPDGGGEFWATTLFGPEAIVQLRLPGNATDQALGEVSFRVSEVGVITESFAGGSLAPNAGFCGNPACIVDASCYNGANSIKDAYAKMEWVAGAYIYTCTGGLLNDSNPTQGNFFLTANHCFSKTSTAKNVTFYWRFRTSACNGSCPSNSGWPYKTTGAAVKASNRKGDFTLLQLNANPPSGSTLLGFTSAPVANTNGVALHRVSNPNFGPQVYNEQSVSTSAPTCRSWPRGERIYSRDTLGGTDGGSSGSPVVNGSDQVVGQLSGACGSNVNDPCDSTNNATVDGALAYYWASVQPYLAP